MVETRLLDLGTVSALRSQTLFHAIAETAAADDAPTLCVLSPDAPYVSIGYHQDAAEEIDLDFCRERAVAVLRRRVGGGAVLLDADQLFFHLILPERSLERLGLSARLDRRYRELAAPALMAYRRLGLAAEFRPPNDLFAGGRKIGGTGAASIGEAFVFVGSLMRRFDHALMARVLRFEDEALRDRVARSIENGVTSIERELGAAPAMDDVRRALLEGFREAMPVAFVERPLAPAELDAIARLDAEFPGDDWLHHVSSNGRERRLTIHAGHRFRETAEGWLEERTA